MLFKTFMASGVVAACFGWIDAAQGLSWRGVVLIAWAIAAAIIGVVAGKDR